MGVRQGILLVPGGGDHWIVDAKWTHPFGVVGEKRRN